MGEHGKVQTEFSGYRTIEASVRGLAVTGASHLIVAELTVPTSDAARLALALTRVVVVPGSLTAAANVRWQIIKTTTAGSSGAITPLLSEDGDTLPGGLTFRSMPGTPGTEAATAWVDLDLWSLVTASGNGPLTVLYDAAQQTIRKPIIVRSPAIGGSGVVGIAIKATGAAGGAGFSAHATFAISR